MAQCVEPMSFLNESVRDNAEEESRSCNKEGLREYVKVLEGCFHQDSDMVRLLLLLLLSRFSRVQLCATP